MNDRTAEAINAVLQDADERRIPKEKPDPAEPPESCQDWAVHMKLTPERHESIAKSWSIEESTYRFRRQRGETLLNELVIHHIGNVKTTPQEVQNLAESLAKLKKEDVALDRVRAQIEIEKIRAANRLECERIRAQNRLDLEDRRHQHRLERINRHQKNWLAREITRQKNRKELESARINGRLTLEDKKAKHRFRLTRMGSAGVSPASRTRSAGASPAPPPLRGSVASCPRGSSKDPYPPGARYGRDASGRPYTRKEFMKHLRRACYDIYGLNPPGEANPDLTARDPDTYEHQIDENGDYIETPEEKAEALRHLQQLDPTYRPTSEPSQVPDRESPTAPT